MAETTIEWTRGPNGEKGFTFNPWEGCQKVGPGCDHCYAETRNARFAGGQAINWGPGAPRRRTSAKNWYTPFYWNDEAKRLGVRYRVFCASLADVFDNEVPENWRVDLFTLIEQTPNLDWLLLTKRIGNVPAMLPWRACSEPWPNVWIGATIVNQAEADRDIPKLLKVPAAKRFLSMEPLLGPVDVRWAFPDIRTASCHRCGFRTNQVGGVCPNDGETLRGDVGVDWVIVGGESGPNARPMHPDWARSLRDQCQAAGVPFFFKQWGEFAPNWLNDDAGQKIVGSEWIDRMGKKIAGRLLDGRTWDEVPV